MAKRGRRYEEGPKLNMKKVVATLVIILVIFVLIFGIKKMLDKDASNISGKIETVCYYTIYDNGKWGVINSYGDIVVKPKYDEMIVIPNETQDIFICTYDVDYASGNYKTKVINAKEKEIVKEYDKVEAIANHDKTQNIWYEKNVFRTQKNGKYGLINYSGKVLTQCEYEEIIPIFGIENSLLIKKDGKYGLCDDLGNMVIEPKYQRIEKIGDDYKNGYIVVDENQKYGIIGFDKQEILETKYTEIKGICGINIYVVKDSDKYFLTNQSGEKIINKGFEDILEINKDYAVVKQNGKYGVIDIAGNTKIDFQYDSLAYASGSDYIAKSGDKYGVVATDGTKKIDLVATKIDYISSGSFYIVDEMKNGKAVSKIYDANYQEKLSGTISEVNTAKGYIRMYTNEEYKYYNFKFEEKAASQLLNTNTLFLSKKDGKYGFVNADGKVIVDYQYDDATEQNSSGYAGIKKDGVWGSIDLTGKVVVEPKYNLDNNKKIDFIGAWHLCEDTNANYYLDA